MSARTMWAGILGGAALLDIICNERDERQQAHPLEGTTLSSTVRYAVAQLGPAGPVLFTAACVGVPWWFHGHILAPLRRALGS